MVEFYHCTLRDGAQMEGLSFSLQDKLKIAERLDDLGVHYIEGGYPGSNPKGVEFFQRAREMTYRRYTSRRCAIRAANTSWAPSSMA
jgi:2-isopropylmalate synthase